MSKEKIEKFIDGRIEFLVAEERKDKMRITIETTNSKSEFSSKVTKEVVGDDMDIYDMAELFRSILLAQGFSVGTVDGILPQV